MTRTKDSDRRTPDARRRGQIVALQTLALGIVVYTIADYKITSLTIPQLLMVIMLGFIADGINRLIIVLGHRHTDRQDH